MRNAAQPDHQSTQISHDGLSTKQRIYEAKGLMMSTTFISSLSLLFPPFSRFTYPSIDRRIRSQGTIFFFFLFLSSISSPRLLSSLSSSFPFLSPALSLFLSLFSPLPADANQPQRLMACPPDSQAPSVSRALIWNINKRFIMSLATPFPLPHPNKVFLADCVIRALRGDQQRNRPDYLNCGRRHYGFIPPYNKS